MDQQNNNRPRSRGEGSYYGGSRPGYSDQDDQQTQPQQRPVRRTAPTAAPGQGTRYRSAGYPSSAGTGSRTRQAAAQRTSSSTARRPAQTARRKSASRNSNGTIPPVLLLICAVLVVALLVGVTVRVTRYLAQKRNVPVVVLTPPDTATPAPEENTGVQVASQPEATPTPEPSGDTGDVPDDGQTATDEPEPSTPEPEWSAPVQSTSGASGGTGGLRSATILTCGDVIMHDTLLATALVDKSSKTYNFDNYFSTIGHVMMDADWSVINIEATLREGKYGYKGYPQFSTPPSILSTLTACGIDMITMCNNHMLDGYWDGLRLSIDLVEQAGLQHVGAYRTPEEYNAPEIMEINGIRVGFLNYTQTTNTMEQHSDKAAQEYGFRYVRKADFAERCQALRQAGAEVIVAYMHWGEEYERTPESSTKKYAQQLVAAGVDIIVGGHPHVVQPAEYITATTADGTSRTALCIYSIGNFISDQRARYTDSGVIFKFTIQEREGGGFDIVNPTYIPTYVWRTGSEKAGYDYRILAIGEYMDKKPEGMSSSDYDRMKQCWYEISQHLGGDSILTAAVR